MRVEPANAAPNVLKRLGRRRTTGEGGVVEAVGMVGPQPPLARRDSRPHPATRFPPRLKFPRLSDASQILGPGGDEYEGLCEHDLWRSSVRRVSEKAEGVPSPSGEAMPGTDRAGTGSPLTGLGGSGRRERSRHEAVTDVADGSDQCLVFRGVQA